MAENNAISLSKSLLKASRQGHTALAVEIIESKESNTTYKNTLNIEAREDGLTNLMHASYYGHCGIINLLYLKGANLEAVTNRLGSRFARSGCTALCFASMQQRLDALTKLIDFGANVNVIFSFEERCEDCGAPRAAERWTPLSFACSHGHFQVASILLDAGADVNATIDGDGRLWSPLFHAIQPTASIADGSRQYVSLIKKLLAANGKAAARNLEARDDDGMTVFLLAAMSRRLEAIKILSKHGADVNATDTCTGQNALHWAILPRHIEEGQGLLSNVVPSALPLQESEVVSVSDFASHTPSSSPTTTTSTTSTTDNSVDNNNQLNLYSNNEKTKNGSSGSKEGVGVKTTSSLKSIELLLKLGVNPAAKDFCGRAPADVAEMAGRWDLACLLREHQKILASKSRSG